MKYRFAQKEKLLSFGGYPEVSLSEAREAHHRDGPKRVLQSLLSDSARIESVERSASPANQQSGNAANNAPAPACLKSVGEGRSLGTSMAAENRLAVPPAKPWKRSHALADWMGEIHSAFVERLYRIQPELLAADQVSNR